MVTANHRATMDAHGKMHGVIHVFNTDISHPHTRSRSIEAKVRRAVKFYTMLFSFLCIYARVLSPHNGLGSIFVIVSLFRMPAGQPSNYTRHTLQDFIL